MHGSAISSISSFTPTSFSMMVHNSLLPVTPVPVAISIQSVLFLQLKKKIQNPLSYFQQEKEKYFLSYFMQM